MLPPPTSYQPDKTPSISRQSKVRNSNLELYRIIVMLMIVAHHYVVNSGLFQLIKDSPLSPSTATMLLFGAWGKTGINCFLLITGYFMCKSTFSWRKLLKLYLQITLYTVCIYVIFCLTGHEKFSAAKMIWTLWPIKNLTSNDFVSCFLMFYLFIPFLNIFIANIDKRNHFILLILLLVFYGLLPSIPIIPMSFSYVSWFMAIYIISAYIRLYGLFPKFSYKKWGWVALLLVIISSASILALESIYKLGLTSHYLPFFLVADSNKILSILIGISSFMFFKDLKIPHSKFINIVGGATFGVLLIHANSDAMRQWLWKDTVDCIGHFGPSIIWTLGYAIISVLCIFVICVGIDWFRSSYIEPRLLDFFQGKLRYSKNKILSFMESK